MKLVRGKKVPIPGHWDIKERKLDNILKRKKKKAGNRRAEGRGGFDQTIENFLDPTGFGSLRAPRKL